MELKTLPYVNGLPGEGQTRINWIKNGESLDGASTKFGVDGALNRGPNQVQENVVVLNDNIETIAEKTTEMDSQIETINSILSVSENVDAMAQIGKNTTDIGLLKTANENVQTGILDLDTRVDFLEEDIGTYNPTQDTLYRPVRSDLYWIKREMGQYPGQDINGQSVSGNESTGMKRRIIDNTSSIVQSINRITELENLFNDSDVGSLTIEVQNLRSEMGPRGSATIDPVYTRLTKTTNTVNGLLVSMEDVMDSIGYNEGVPSIITLVNSNTSEITEINRKLSTPSTGIIPRIEVIEQQIGTENAPLTIRGRIKTNTDSINSLYQIVGADTSSGLRGQVAWINQVVGIVPEGSQPPTTSLIYKMTALENQQSSINDSIQDLQVEIGNNNEGLKGQVIRLSDLMNGTDPNGSTVESRGVLNTIKNHETRLNQIDTTMQSFITEAPLDGKAYVRVNGAWVDIETLNP
ncbi:fibritin neck whiskers protein [Citrobacter phage CkP1]|nr:fibritin neck whiskers protein [Citrobacter phage CkP1]